FGSRVHGDFAGSPGDGVPSWEDPRTWICFGEEPLTSYEFAGLAAHLVLCLDRAGAPDASGLLPEAITAWNWAEANVQPSEAGIVRDARLYAAACLYRAMGDAAYQTEFAAALLVSDTYASVFDYQDQRHGIWSYVLADGVPSLDVALRDDLRTATVQFAEDWNMFAWERRNFRFGGYWWTPMLIGQATTPFMLATVAAHHLTDDPRYLDALTTTSDYFLGGNPTNMVWVTGLGDRSPEQVLHLDSWYDDTAAPVPGIVPYGPHRGEDDQWIGPWDTDYARQRGVYPPVDAWPGHELWFENRYCPITNEYTVHQNIAPAAAVYGYLCAPNVAVVGVGDLLAVLAAWGPCADCPADRNGDGTVDVNDLLSVLAAWGTSTCD
ncbi:MAG: glycoside hydrolase family 9 protein, partial [Phycisphaerales bacterium]